MVFVSADVVTVDPFTVPGSSCVGRWRFFLVSFIKSQNLTLQFVLFVGV